MGNIEYLLRRFAREYIRVRKSLSWNFGERDSTFSYFADRLYRKGISFTDLLDIRLAIDSNEDGRLSQNSCDVDREIKKLARIYELRKRWL